MLRRFDSSHRCPLATRVEVGRSGTVRYLEQDLGAVLISSRAKRECQEKEGPEGEKWKEVHAMSCWVGKDARESFPGKSGHVPALSDAANLLERSSLEKSYFLRHAAFRFSLSFLLFLLFLFSTTFLFVEVVNSSISSFPIFFLFGIIFMKKVLDRSGEFCIRCLEFFTSMELNNK